MLETITTSDIEIGLSETDWCRALRRSSRSLLETGKITAAYIDAMIDSVKRVGPYIVLCKQVALAHARPDGNVRELAVHFSTFTPGVKFGVAEYDPVRLIITLAAVDDTSHLDLMAELASVLMYPEHVDALIAAQDAQEFLYLLKKFAAEDV